MTDIDSVAENETTVPLLPCSDVSSYGKVLAKGAPRITRFRPSQSRFTVVDPSGNNIIFIQRDEPEDLEYGGSKSLKGLARAVDNARILREFKNDDRTAARVLDVGLRRFPGADAVDLVKALTARAEIAIALGEIEIARKIREAVDAVTLGPGDAESLADELDSVRRLEAWLTDTDR